MALILITILTVTVIGVFGAPQQTFEAVSGATGGVTPVPIISQTETNSVDGSFSYSYEAGNGIKNQGQGFLKKISVPILNDDGSPTGQEEEKEIVVQTGSYSYPSPDGQIITINYVADENGFQPTGDHIPTPPAIPDQILSSLQKQSVEAAQEHPESS